MAKRFVRALMAMAFLASPSYSQVLINEICSANGDVLYDPDFYNYSPWVELYNAGNGTVNLGGFYLSDDDTQRNKWRIPTGTSIPAKGFLILWCDNENTGLHTNFSLDSDGETVVLSNASQVLVDKIVFPKQYTNVSYGRLTNGGSEIGYMTTPTYKAGNNNKTGSERLANPNVSQPAGRYVGTVSVTLSHPQAGVVIRYTTDGSDPSETSAQYSGPVLMASTTTLKAKAFASGFLPSKTEANTYFINQHGFTLPVLSIATTPDYLWNNTFGIYTDGTNGVTGNCQDTPKNWNRDWKRHATIEYFEPTGEKVWDQGVDIRIGGACSRGFPQKSFVVQADDKYGKNHIDEKLFDNKTAESYGGFFLRNSGNDFNTTFFRDALQQRLAASQMDLDYMDYKPTIFYLNGQYWGIQNMREKIDGDYIESNYGIDKDDVDLIETWGNAIEGTADAYNTYLSTLQSMDRSTDEAFAYIDSHIDVQEYINYLTTEIYLCNTDWPGNNQKFWRQRSTNGKFRWILWDLDFGLGLYTGASYPTHPTLEFATDPDNTSWPNPAASTLHIRLVLENPEFRKRFIQTFAAAMSSSFSPTIFNTYMTEFQQRIQAEVPYHKDRWGGTTNDWNWEVERAKTFIQQRQPYMAGHFADFFGLNQRVTMNVSSAPAGASGFLFNSVKSNGPIVNGVYYLGLEYSIEALPALGYSFDHWTITKQDIVTQTLIAQGSAWRYFDQGSLPAANWTVAAYNDGAWGQGNAQLGYGDGDEQTVVGYGADPNNKYPTTYFRRVIDLDATDIANLGDITGGVNFDDGVVVYVNGVEVFRNNMPAGTISNGTFATQAVADENAFVSFTFNKSLFVIGANVIAVEVHQSSGSSSDVSFDLHLTSTKTGTSSESTSTDPVLTGVVDSNLTLVAHFNVVPVLTGLVINELSASPSDVTDEFGEDDDWIEILNNTDSPLDLAGLYITDALANKNKYQIPTGSSQTVIPAHGYKVLWADDAPGQGVLHLPFKLSADGEAVGLYQLVNGSYNTLDEITFGVQQPATSFARIPDGTGPFTTTSVLTPGATNVFGVVTGVEEDLLRMIRVFPNPTTDRVIIQSSATDVRQIRVVDLVGREIFRTGGVTEATVTLPSRGVYVIQLVTSSGTAAVKVVRE